MTTAPTQPAPRDREADERAGKWLMRLIVFGLLGVSVSVHFTALSYVFSTDTDLVRDDYYDLDQRYEGELARFRAGAAWGWQIERGDDGVIAVTVGQRAKPSGAAAAEPPSGGAGLPSAAAPLRVLLTRASNARLDQALTLRPGPATETTRTWRSPPTELVPGYWKLRVELGDPDAGPLYESELRVD